MRLIWTQGALLGYFTEKGKAMARNDLITKDFALYVVHYFASMLTWSKKDILSEIDRTIKEAKPAEAVPEKQYNKLLEEHIELREQFDNIFLEYHALRDAFVDYVCSGIPNPSSFCKNKCPGCCDAYGWCKNNDKCKGFNPAEVFLEGVKYVETEKPTQEVDFDYSAED